MVSIRDKALPIAIGLVLAMGCGAWASEFDVSDPVRRGKKRTRFSIGCFRITAACGLATSRTTLRCRKRTARSKKCCPVSNHAEQGSGSESSENPVAAALQWLAAHQMPDGGWSFKHSTAPACDGQCRHDGNMDEARNAATAMALLSFLGARQTQKEGKYKDTIEKGLNYLVERMKIGPNGGSLHEPGGTMYSHGLASIVLCEAYAMAKDKSLERPAQAAINFIVYAQDPVGGGWRYQPKQAGDTSVTGWQILALQSGHMAYLSFPPVTIQKAFRFLDSVQSDEGAKYGYTKPEQARITTTAIGLLSRMYLGWKKDNPTLRRGVEWLAKEGPSETNLYYNYYATQVMWHWGGEEWKQWHRVIRDRLVKSQATEGHEAGSWGADKGDHGTKLGGRLYHTAMAAMILEVQHHRRFLVPTDEDDFPVE